MKPYLLLAFLFLTLTLSAQDRKGNFYFSGNTGAEYSKLGSEDVSFVRSPANLLQRFAGVRAQSFRSGYFLSNRFLLGARVDYFNATGNNFQGNNDGVLQVKPFLRYYFLDLQSAPLAFFGELGFGTFGAGNTTGFETDFHLGLGTELVVAPGVLGTANLNYDANADGVNYTNLVVGLNALTGQLQGAPAVASVRRGTFSSNGQFLRIAYGRNQNGGNLISDFGLQLTPRVGYFVLDGLMVEGVLDYIHSRYTQERAQGSFGAGDLASSSAEAGVQLRYYPLQRGRLLPYVTAGGGYLQFQVTAEQLGQLDGTIDAAVWQAGAGASYFLSSQLALDLSVNYNTGKSNFKNSSSLGDGVRERQLRGTVGLRFFLSAE